MWYAAVKVNSVVDTFCLLTRGAELHYIQELSLNDLRSKYTHASAFGVNGTSTIMDDLQYDMDALKFLTQGAVVKWAKYKEFGLYLLALCAFLGLVIGQAVL